MQPVGWITNEVRNIPSPEGSITPWRVWWTGATWDFEHLERLKAVVRHSDLRQQSKPQIIIGDWVFKYSKTGDWTVTKRVPRSKSHPSQTFRYLAKQSTL